MNIGSLPGANIDIASLKAIRDEKAAQLFKATDTDKSGGINIAEFTKALESKKVNEAKNADKPPLEEIFARLDIDNSGEITKAELKNAKPPSPGNNLTPATFSSLLQIQEEAQDVANNSPYKKLIETASNNQDTASDLVDQLLNSLIKADEE